MMFSALKFIAASVIVALFGGFLMMGVLTTQQGDDVLMAASPSPTIEATGEPTEAPAASVRTDLLPGVALTVAEVEPDVFHVLSDGVRDLALGRDTDIVAGHDEGIWLLRKDRFHRLGSEAGHAWPDVGRPPSIEITPDGTVWTVARQNRLLSSDGDGWVHTPPRYPDGDNPKKWSETHTIAVAPNGTLWAQWLRSMQKERGGTYDNNWIGYLGPDGWQTYSRRWAPRLYPTDSGILYIPDCFGPCRVSRLEHGVERQFTGPVDTFGVSPDGIVWLVGPLGRDDGEEWPYDGANADKVLARFDGEEWDTWSPDELPDMGLGISLDGFHDEGWSLDTTFQVAPDGSMWASLWQRGPDGDVPPEHGLWTPEQRFGSCWEDAFFACPPAEAREVIARYDPRCDGVVRFDGATADRFLPGRCITMDIAADGSVWVLADEDKGKDLYVITPEAVAAE